MSGEGYHSNISYIGLKIRTIVLKKIYIVFWIPAYAGMTGNWLIGLRKQRPFE